MYVPLSYATISFVVIFYQDAVIFPNSSNVDVATEGDSIYLCVTVDGTLERAVEVSLIANSGKYICTRAASSHHS